MPMPLGDPQLKCQDHLVRTKMLTSCFFSCWTGFCWAENFKITTHLALSIRFAFQSHWQDLLHWDGRLSAQRVFGKFSLRVVKCSPHILVFLLEMWTDWTLDSVYKYVKNADKTWFLKSIPNNWRDLHLIRIADSLLFVVGADAEIGEKCFSCTESMFCLTVSLSELFWAVT